MNIIFNPDQILAALAGGILIGISAAGMYLIQGRIAGISGIFSQFLRSPFQFNWQTCFILGLIAGGIIASLFVPDSFPAELPVDVLFLIPAGFLVGFGSRFGGGCTSGHGVCGLGRLSFRSLVATLTFMGTGFLTVYLLYHVFEVLK